MINIINHERPNLQYLNCNLQIPIFMSEYHQTTQIMESVNTKLGNYNFQKIVDAIVRLFVLYLLFSWCFSVVQPFIYILIWGSIIAIAVYPIYSYLVKVFRGSRLLSAGFITLIMLSVLVIPSIFLADSLIDGIGKIRAIFEQGQPLLPPPGENTKNWPAITKPILDFWQAGSEDLLATTKKYESALLTIARWIADALAGIGKGVGQFVISILVSGVLLFFSSSSISAAHKFFKKLAGSKGESYVTVSAGTIRNVVKGILGVAFIQASLAGIGFFIAGVPHAGLWTVLCLILAIVQLGAGPVAIPVCIYMFSTADTLTAILLAAWMVVVLVSDNILKPLLLGRGSTVPMLVVFIGAIGGFMHIGFLGLFLGAVVLTLGYNLYQLWLNSEATE